MASEMTRKHPFHMVEPSSWPIIGTAGAFAAAVGLVYYMHGGPLLSIAPGLLVILVTMYGWWRDVIKEAQSGHDHTSTVQHGLRMGMVLFIASEVMFFVAFFWAFFNSSVPAISFAAQDVWPPEGITPLDPWTLPFANTLILLTSGATVTWAHQALIADNRKHLILGLFLTVALGVIFLCTQAYEYYHASFKFTDGIYSTTFYLATGFHGFHVFIGTIFLFVCLMRARKGHFTPEQHVGFEAAAWYWHFVDVVWLFLFASVYLWGNSGYTGAY